MLIVTPGSSTPREQMLEQLDVEYRALRADLGRASSAVKRARDHQVRLDDLMARLRGQS